MERLYPPKKIEWMCANWKSEKSLYSIDSAISPEFDWRKSQKKQHNLKTQHQIRDQIGNSGKSPPTLKWHVALNKRGPISSSPSEMHFGQKHQPEDKSKGLIAESLAGTAWGILVSRRSTPSGTRCFPRHQRWINDHNKGEFRAITVVFPNPWFHLLPF